MNCEGYYRHIRAYCERELDEETRGALEAHVRGCARCAAFHAVALEITCREVAELYDYVARTLAPERRAVFDRHFQICAECRDYLRSYERSIEVGKAALAEPEDRAVPEEFVRAILAARRRC